jgi:TRAP-type uncharacterized transport system fused permease subunit
MQATIDAVTHGKNNAFELVVAVAVVTLIVVIVSVTAIINKNKTD